jgi:hypothetical protein
LVEKVFFSLVFLLFNKHWMNDWVAKKGGEKQISFFST